MKKIVITLGACCLAFSGWGMNSGHFTDSKMKKSGGSLARLSVTTSGQIMKPSDSSDSIPLSPSHSGKITRYASSRDEIMQNLRGENIDVDKIVKTLNQYPSEASFYEIYTVAAQKGIPQIVAWPFIPENTERLSLNVQALLTEVCKIAIDINQSQNQIDLLTAIFDTGIFNKYPNVMKNTAALISQQANKNRGSQVARKLDNLVKSWRKK